MQNPHLSIPRPSFRVGVDSDGTVFDSMEIKHKRVFQPLAVEIWNLGEVEQEFYEIAEKINLYSVHRGVNRFQGLAMTFERLGLRTGWMPREESVADLAEFVLSGAATSTASLKAFNRTRKSKFLDQVIEWSRESDLLYEKITTSEGNPAYSCATNALRDLSENAEIMVISSSSREALYKDWGDADLLPLTTKIAGQEVGSKVLQIRDVLLEPGPEHDCCLMIGDAPGDLDAARSNQILFYPILPGAEEDSWKRFHEEAMERFFAGDFSGIYQDSLLEKFEAALQQDDPWPHSQ